jgi:hypothetical protein
MDEPEPLARLGARFRLGRDLPEIWVLGYFRHSERRGHHVTDDGIRVISESVRTVWPGQEVDDLAFG